MYHFNNYLITTNIMENFIKDINKLAKELNINFNIWQDEVDENKERINELLDLLFPLISYRDWLEIDKWDMIQACTLLIDNIQSEIITLEDEDECDELEDISKDDLIKIIHWLLKQND